MNNSVEQTGDIAIKGRNEAKPSEITLGYLVNDLKVVESIKNHDYDLNINLLNFNSLNFIDEKSSLKELFKTEKVFTIDRLYNLKLFDLSFVGMGLAPEMNDSKKESNRYRYLSELTKCANEAINLEEEKESAYLSVWKNQYAHNIKKFDIAQCKNKIGLGKLYLLKYKLKAILKKIDKKICCQDNSEISAMIQASYNFFDTQLSIFDASIHPSIKSSDMLFYKIDMLHSEKKPNRKSYSTNDLIEKLDCYRYVFNAYLFLLTNDLKRLKQIKIKKATDVFLVDSFDSKKATFNQIDDSNYEELQMYDLVTFYDWYRNSLIGIINKIIDNDIKRRQVTDALFQYIPTISSVIVFIVSLYLSFTYTFTLLKEMWKRQNLMILYAVILVCAIISAINLYRNAKKFKRPARKKFSIASLYSFLLISVVFFSLNLYYINRYDGYDNIYYYVYDGSNIKIDGLVENDYQKYELPASIDGYNISMISDNVFKNNKQIRELDLSKSNAQLDKNCFGGCTNLEKIALPDFLKVIPKNAFTNCEKLETVESKFGIEEVGYSAFGGCKSLQNINFANIKKLESSAFQDCVSLASIDFNNNLIEIPDHTFMNCKKLNFASLPNNLVKIGENAFYSCTAIKSLTLSNTIQTIENNAFGGYTNISSLDIGNLNAVQDKKLSNVFGNLFYVKSMSIAGSTNIPEDFLSICPNIVSFETKCSINTIEARAFKDCRKLKTCQIFGTISNLGASAFFNCIALENLSIENLNISSIETDTFNNCESISNFIIPQTVKAINDRAFYGCVGLSAFEIPSSVIKLGQDIFSGCFNLRSLAIPYAPDNKKLSTICGNDVAKELHAVQVLNADVIPPYFFEDCFNMSQLLLNNSIQEIGEYAFKNCWLLDDFSFVSDATKIGTGAFFECDKLSSITLNNAITKVPDYAFYNCLSLNNIILSNSISEIGNYSYSGCSQLNSVSLGKNIKKIGTDAFSSTMISTLNIPLLDISLKDFLGVNTIMNLVHVSIYVIDSTNLPARYFENCSKLNRININGDITSIGDYAFNNCYALENYDILNSVVSLGDYAFRNTGISTLIIPNNIKNVGIGAFANCSELTDITIQSSIDAIPNEMFKSCKSLNNITLSPTIKAIGVDSFNDCSSLASISNWTQIKTIKKSAFKNCKALKNITIDNINELGSNAFYGCILPSELILVEKENFDNNSLNGIIGVSKLVISQDNKNNINPISFYLGESILELKRVDIKHTVSINKGFMNDCVNVQEISVDDNMESLGSSAFAGLTQLKDICLSDSIMKIGSYAFYGCESLSEVVLPKKLQIIGKYAFFNTSLKKVSLIDNIQYIGMKAFNSNTEIENINAKNQIYSTIWDKNWNGSRPVNLQTIYEDSFDWIFYNYNLFIIFLVLLFLLLQLLLV